MTPPSGQFDMPVSVACCTFIRDFLTCSAADVIQTACVITAKGVFRSTPIAPEPWHFEHVFGCVPGFAPEPLQVLHSSSRL